MLTSSTPLAYVPSKWQRPRIKYLKYTMLDSNVIVHRTASQLRRARIWRAFYNGVKVGIARGLQRHFYLLTLTSGRDSPQTYKKSCGYYITLSKTGVERIKRIKDVSALTHDFDVLKKRIRRKYKGFEYAMVRTKEGFGVLHVLFRSKSRIGVNWLREQWKELRNAVQLRIDWCYNVGKKLINYLVGKYLSHHVWTRLSYSHRWIWVGWLKMWKYLFKWNSFSSAIRLFEYLIFYRKLYMSVKQLDIRGFLDSTRRRQI